MNAERTIARAEALCLRLAIRRAKSTHARHSHLERRLVMVVARMAAMEVAGD